MLHDKATSRPPAKQLRAWVILAVLLIVPRFARAAADPGVRGGTPSAGGALPGLTADESTFFNDGQTRFQNVETVRGSSNVGLGPRFNLNQCSGCHSQPAIGGSSPPTNPQVAVATLDGAKNSVPWFVTAQGPVREARFKTDGGVHDLYVITGRGDASGCSIAQPSFTPAGNPLTGQGGNPNIIFRIPTPTFGAGLIEAIPDSTILANMSANARSNAALGISGHPNLSGNDGSITRFGWKAQNKSLLMFAGEAYNVEMGISNQLFPQKRDETQGCVLNPTPDDYLNFSASPNSAVLSDIEAFADFMRMLAPPTPAPDTASTIRGRTTFRTIGCAACHTPSMKTGKNTSGSGTIPSAALSNQQVNLFSDLLLHNMGRGLGDGISQGAAGPNEFRTAPLWGLGQRIFFLHDGRTSDLLQAILAHADGGLQNAANEGPQGNQGGFGGRGGSEADQVIANFENLSDSEQQDVLNFLRGL